MDCKVSFASVLSVLAKVLCISVLIIQSALLDYIIIRLDKKASDAGRYIWIALDSIVVIFWVLALIFSFRFFHKPNQQKMSNQQKMPDQQKMPAKGYTGIELFKLALRELPFAYVSWLLYAVVLIVKINRMFESFAEILTSSQESLLTNTSLKIILSLAGVLFALLAYSHHNEAHNSKYRLMIEKLGTAASLDLLDVVMLLDILFVVDNGVEVTFELDRTIRTFSSICILLPVFPLLALRIISSSDTAESKRALPLTMVINSVLYIFLVNIPLLCIRMYLWLHHEVDVTTFLTKNVMAIFKGFLDIYKDLVIWRRDIHSARDTAIQMEPVANV